GSSSRWLMAIVFIGGRARTMSARSRPASISTRKPSRSRSLESVISCLTLMTEPFGSLESRGRGDGLFAHILSGDEVAAQELANRRFRDVLDEHVAARALEIRQTGVAAMVVERLRG